MERNLVFVALFAAITVALGLIPLIPVPGAPITAQSLGIMLCGTVLGAKRGALAALLFVLLVALNLPVLAGGRGGLGLFVSGSGGFLVGFPVAAFVTGIIVERWRSAALGLVAFVAALAGCIVVLYVFGIAGLAMALSKSIAEAALLVLAYIPGDIIKAVIAGIITSTLYRLRPASVFSRQQVSGKG